MSSNAPTIEGSSPLNGQRLAVLARLEERRYNRRTNLFRLLFVLGLLAWGSLAAWWGTYLYITTQQIREMTLRAYQAEERYLALAFSFVGSDFNIPEALEETPFQLAELPLDEDTLEFPHVALDGPRTGLAIVVRPEERARMRLEARRKLIMLAGEGTLLIGLLFVSLIGLHRMLQAQWRLNRKVEAFVHTITHELKSPIAGMRVLLQSLRNLKLPPEEQAAYLDLGLAETSRLDRMVGNILMSSRLDGAVFSPRIEELELRPIIEQLAARKELMFADQQGSISLNLPGNATVMADPEALDSILENLLDNALKYGGNPPKAAIHIDQGEPGRLLLTVEDNGAGLSQEEISQIFRKFHRAGGDEEVRQAKGTGLGLYIARNLARACQGELSAHSDGPGHGSRFILELPQGPSSRRHSEAPRSKTKRVEAIGA